jgi:hypothetical protein
MPDKLVYALRNIAATLITLSGIGHIATLWLRDLTGGVLTDALLGAVYLIIGIGLFGQSRFTLFMAIVIPAAAAGLLLYAFPNPGQVHTARLAVDAAVILCSTIVLWHVRNNPSV